MMQIFENPLLKTRECGKRRDAEKGDFRNFVIFGLFSPDFFRFFTENPQIFRKFQKKESCRRRPLPSEFRLGSSESETPAKKASKSFPVDIVKEEPIDDYPTTKKIPETSKSTQPMIVDSNIVRSELHNVVLSNCRIENSQIFNSKIFGKS
ncbi:hypothetical protein B9Z55_003426 [Caenorhabditis nigoni]|nr:hypothetical protein B9Z55_003426 [Caenorhabditis nigoni]